MSIAAKLLSMHSLFAFSILMAAFVVLSMGGFFVTRRFMPRRFEPSHNNIAGYIFGALGTVYAVLLGFAIFMVWQEYEQTEQYAALEAGEAVAVYRDLSLYPDREVAKPIKESLASYMRSVINEEYPAMAQMKRSKPTEEAFHDLWRKLGTLNPRDLREQTLYNQVLTDMHNLAKSRTNRLQAAEDEMPEMMWLALIFGAVVTLGCALFFSADHIMAHLTLTCLLAAVLATVWFVIMGLDHAFVGWAGIKSSYCEKALEIILQGS
ncbi:MAG: DUF4239 domain-containing protein [Syntrophobacteraceae bacterium]